MTTILLVGTDDALLEGLAQTLGAVGHQSRIAHSVAEAVELSAGAPALIAVVERALTDSGEVLRLPLLPGGALLLYRAATDLPAGTVARSVQRLTLAELTLPLERQRLIALVQHVEERARRTGRGGRADESEEREAAGR